MTLFAFDFRNNSIPATKIYATGLNDQLERSIILHMHSRRRRTTHSHKNIPLLTNTNDGTGGLREACVGSLAIKG